VDRVRRNYENTFLFNLSSDTRTNYVEPRSLNEVVDAVKAAYDSHRHLKVVGGTWLLHSYEYLMIGSAAVIHGGSSLSHP